MTVGRPSEYTPEVEIAICEAIASGKSLREICKADEMPSRETVYQWMAKNQSFADRYARAVEDRAEKLAEEILSISDDDSGDVKFKESEDGDGKGAVPFVDHENIQRSKLRVDSRKWIASKLFPKKYGDRVENRISDADGKPINFAVSINLVRPQSDSANS